MIVTCRRFVEIITADAEGALPSWEKTHFDEHRHVCGPCRRYKEGFESTVTLLHELQVELPNERPSRELMASLLEKLRARHRP